ncbi:hypothetical protein AVEN_145065-1 [Araneus ventricosus]|uniref:Uncharacterized protein n=1 Tax=Araneus ventricosus TaxID=182803 RepID=A0A4Y2BVQ4_ARAVE|nr:hypothetical protein AVEN_249454-1 [Araneus ventricosus]GBL95517.1 hypothetical protein AVEN_250848-1 [Araneus ventricosus]GBL95527.1 hypothetical protein AVEN_269817-1 [Araneus ventricosus]GBL95545.1 hypothetical protein AVEN_145065-1 [Araneus ventricosus]
MLNHSCLAFVPTVAVMQFCSDEQSERTASILAIGVQSLLMIPFLIDFLYSMLMYVNQQKCERTINETTYWVACGTIKCKPLVAHAADGTFKCEPPVVHAAHWYIPMRGTGGTRRPMGPQLVRAGVNVLKNKLQGKKIGVTEKLIFKDYDFIHSFSMSDDKTLSIHVMSQPLDKRN